MMKSGLTVYSKRWSLFWMMLNHMRTHSMNTASVRDFKHLNHFAGTQYLSNMLDSALCIVIPRVTCAALLLRRPFYLLGVH